MRPVLYLISFMVSGFAFGQYWFGPTAGAHLTDHSYQLSTYNDEYEVKPNTNFHVGAQFFYTANNTYSVFSELLYERIGKEVNNIPAVTSPALSKSQYHFLSIPLNLRVNFAVPGTLIKLYGGGGIKLSYWLGGRGSVSLEEFDEFFPEGYELEYKMRFRQSRADGFETLANVDANRLQYALQLGAGLTVDITDHSRVVADFRFTFGHSNMGFNGSPDFEWSEYYENFEYRHHVYAISLGYIMEYNAQLARKGKSTNRLSR